MTKPVIQPKMTLKRWQKTTLKNYQIKFSPPAFEVEHILDYLSHHPQLRLQRLSYPQAKVKADNWTKALNKKSKNLKESGSVKVIREFPDGMKMVQLIDLASFQWEGKQMGHCVAGYFGRDTIFSLRDKDNFPHCTLEITKAGARQIKGIGNRKVSPKYHQHIFDYLKERNITITNEYDNFLPDLGYFEFSVAALKFLKEHFDGIATPLVLGRRLYYSAPKGLKVKANPNFELRGKLWERDWNNIVSLVLFSGNLENVKVLTSPQHLSYFKKELQSKLGELFRHKFYEVIPLILEGMNRELIKNLVKELITAEDLTSLNVIYESRPDALEITKNLISHIHNYLFSKKRNPSFIKSLFSHPAFTAAPGLVLLNILEKDFYESSSKEEVIAEVLPLVTAVDLDEKTATKVLENSFSLINKILPFDRQGAFKSKKLIEYLNLWVIKDIQVVEWLLNYNPFASGQLNQFLKMALHSQSEEIFKFLEERGAKIDCSFKPEELHAIIIRAIRKNNLFFVRRILSLGYNPHEFHYEALASASERGYQEIRDALLQSLTMTTPPELTKKSERGETSITDLPNYLDMVKNFVVRI